MMQFIQAGTFPYFSFPPPIQKVILNAAMTVKKRISTSFYCHYFSTQNHPFFKNCFFFSSPRANVRTSYKNLGGPDLNPIFSTDLRFLSHRLHHRVVVGIK